VPARRLAVASGAAAAAVAAIVATVVVAPGHGQPAADHPAATSPSAQPAPTIDVAAARFLQHAAAVVQQQPADPPGPDQYVYTEDNEGGGRVERVWVSTDGNQAGLDMVWQGSRLIYDKAIQPCTLAQVELSNRTEGAQGGDCFVGEGYGPGYFPDMPANPQDLSAYLSEIGVDPAASEAAGMGSDWLANTLGKAVEEVMPFIYLTPAQQAAWYELLAQTPGFTIAHNVRLAAGQTGVGIEWKYLTPYPVAILVFNPVTFAFMGVTGPSGGASDLVRMAFVNEVGQVP
jgi:hypothetical protein